MVSAVKVGGQRLHQLARQGVEVDREPRQVEVTCFAVEGILPAGAAGSGVAADAAGAGGGAAVSSAGAGAPDATASDGAADSSASDGAGDSTGSDGAGDSTASGGAPDATASGNALGVPSASGGTHGPETGAGPVLAVRVECSAGTYVRVLAADLGAALGGGAYVRRLRRTAVGPWTEAMATRLEDLSVADVLAPVASLPWLDAVVVDARRANEVEHGRVLAREGFGGQGEGPWRVVGPSGDLLAVYQGHGAGQVKPAVVLPQPD